MNTTSLRTTFQVGLLVVVALVVAVGGWAFFNGQIRKERTYEMTFLFSDAQGISKQASVYLAGVKIGEVSDVGLSPSTGKAMVRVRIDKKYGIPKESTITVASSLLGGSSAVTIAPPPQSGPLPPDGYLRSGQTVVGQDTLELATIQSQAGRLLTKFDETADKANSLLAEATATTRAVDRLVSDPRLQGSLVSTVHNLDLASAQGLELTHDLREALKDDNAQVKTVLGSVDQTAASLQSATQSNRGKIDQIVDNLNQTSSQIAKLSTTANQTLTQGQTLQNLSDTVANLKAATVKLNSIENDVSSITSDKQVQSDLKETVHNAAIASGNTRILAQRLNALIGGHTNPAGHGNLSFLTSLDFTQNFRTNKFRTDFDFLAPFSNKDFGVIGAYDLTETNRLNLQYGQVSPYNNLLTYRAGIHASKVGIGADYDLFGDRTLSFDLYDPNRLRLDARQKIPLNKYSSIWVGLDDIPRTNAIALGFELQR